MKIHKTVNNALVIGMFFFGAACSGLYSAPPKPKKFRTSDHEALYQRAVAYQKIKHDGGWSILEFDTSKTQSVSGLSNEDRLRLAERLSAEIQAEAAALADTNTGALVQALKDAQQRFGLTPDGVLGTETLTALNRTAGYRLEQLSEALESWAELPEDLGENFLLVNIPAYQLRFHSSANEDLELPIIVGNGDEDQETPTFSDTMTSIVFNPYWNLPRSIVVNEVLPKSKGDIDYFTSRKCELVKDFDPEAEVFPWSDENIEALRDGKFNLRQKPGAKNALGHIKFLFPNKHAVYIHDTPAERLFDKEERDLSHGCIRVKHPHKLASAILKAQGLPEEAAQVADFVDDENWKSIELPKKLPVYIVYHTAFVGQDGKLVFKKDVYDQLTSN